MDIEKLVRTTTEELEKMVSTDTVVGKPMSFEGKTIIPVSKLTFGFGAGAGEGKGNEKQQMPAGEGAGVGAGASLEPVAFIIIDKQDARVFTMKQKGTASEILETITERMPEIMDKAKEMAEGMKKEKKEEKEPMPAPEKPKKR